MRAEAVSVVFAMVMACASAQCCMWCPNGAGVSDRLQGNTAAANGYGMALGRGSGSGGVSVKSAAVDFNVGFAVQTNDTAVSSTIFSAITYAWGSDTYDAIAMLTFNVSLAAWQSQTLIRQNGVAVAAGEPFVPAPGADVTGNVISPLDGAGPITVTTASPRGNQYSSVSYGSFTSAADSSEWFVGWGWSGTSDCSVLPLGHETQLTNVQALDQNNNPIPLVFAPDTALQPFCTLTANTTSYWGFTQVNFAY